MGCCCSSPPPHKEHAPEPGIKLERSCHDVCFLIAFILFWVGMFYVAGEAVKLGDTNRLIYGVGYDGNVCGTNNNKLREVYPDRAQNLESKKYLYFLPRGVNNTSGASLEGICVESCPGHTYLIPESIDQILCEYNVTPALELVGVDGPCWPTYASESLFHRCIPFLDSNTTEEITAGVIEALNLQQAQSLSVKLLGDIVSAWRYIAAAAAGALLLSFLWIFLLRWFAGIIVWATILLVIGSIAALAYLCYDTSSNMSTTYNNLPIYAKLISQEDTIKIMTGVFYTLCVIDGIIILVVLCMCHRVAIAIGLIKEASKVMLKIPTMLLVPIFINLAIVPLAVYFIYIGGYLGTAGTPTYDSDGNFQGYESDETLTYMMLYHLFGGYWTLNFLHALGECIIAGAVASWYWVHDKHDVPSAPVLSSAFRVIRYHMGSLLFGALILSFVQFIRFLLHRFEQSIKGNENALSKFFLKCAQCILACFERFIKFLNTNAYIMVAIYGYSFCEGARRGFSLLATNILRVSALNCVSGFLIFLGKLFVCIVTTLITFVVFSQGQNAEIGDYMLPLIVISILSYAIAIAFFSVFDMAADTLLLCFCEDCDRNDGSEQKPYFMSNTLKKEIDREHGCGLCCCC